MTVRRLSEKEKASACALAWKGFLRYEAPEYSQEGIDAFRRFLDERGFISDMPFYGAFDGEKLVGMLAMRRPQHISLFFVLEEYHRQGIGRMLFERMKQDYSLKEFTVHSSPYAVEAYRHLGFVPLDTERLTDGIRYVPMKYSEKGARSGRSGI